MRMKALAALGALAMACGCSPAEEAELTSVQLVERGDYLVNGVVLCGDCHTPRLENMALDDARELHGAEIGESGPPGVFASYAPPLAGLPADYSEEQFVSFLQTGVRPDGTHPRPPMPPYRLNAADARAVAAYIAALPPSQEEHSHDDH